MRPTTAVCVASIVLAAGCAGAGREASGDPTVPPAPGQVAGCDPDLGQDAAIEVESASYGTTERVRVHLSPCQDGEPLAVLDLLHGAGADETQWVDVGIGERVDAMVLEGRLAPLVVVMPDAAPAYEGRAGGDLLVDHLLHEVEPILERTLALDTQRRAIGGISRGAGHAFAALVVAPGEFVALGGHSPALELSAADAETIASSGVPVEVDAADDDSTLDAAVAIEAALRSRGVDVTVGGGPGRHDRTYWRSQVDAYLTFYAMALRDRQAGTDSSAEYPCDLVDASDVAALIGVDPDVVGHGERYPGERLCMWWPDGFTEPVRLVDDPVDPAPTCSPGGQPVETELERAGRTVRLSACIPDASSGRPIHRIEPARLSQAWPPASPVPGTTTPGTGGISRRCPRGLRSRC